MHKAGEQLRKVWCGHESRHCEEKPLRADDNKCSDSDGPKPPIKRLCSSHCTRKCGGKRHTRAAHDFVEMYKDLNVMILEREIVVVPGEEKSTRADETTTNHQKIEKTPVNDETLEEKPSKIFLSHPVLMRGPIRHVKLSRHLQQQSRKFKKGQIIIDKLSEGRKTQEIPIIKQHQQTFSDNAFRKLSDKVRFSGTSFKST